MHGVLNAASLELAIRDCNERGLAGYAWSFLGENESRYATALELPPVDSPQTAVRAAIVSKAQK